MADLVFNVAKGRAAAYAQNVEDASPTNSAIIIVPINTTDTDADIKDVDTLSALLALGSTSEATGSNWARKTLAAANITITVDDTTNDRVEVAFDSDQTWSAVAASNNVTDLVFCYDPDTTGGTDANIIPLTLHDFAITTDGSDVTATAGDFFRAS